MSVSATSHLPSGGPDPERIRDRLPFLIRRNLTMRGVRAFLEARGCVEVETPCAVPTPGEEVHLLPFQTERETPDGQRHTLFLHTSPEFAMKRIVAATGLPLFQFARVWRNGEASGTHAPEFTMLEWYRPNMALPGLMDETEALLKAVLPPTVHRNACTLDLSQPFERLSMEDAFRRHAGVDLLPTQGNAQALANAAGCSLRNGEQWEDLFFRLLLERIEPAIGQTRPTFLTHWPASQAALARKDPSDPRVALRFELYAVGMELANAFEELTDPVEQRQRFAQDRAERRQLYPTRPTWPMDEKLLHALPHMPPCSGIALGFDRLVMLASGARHIQDVLWIQD
ncbi:EF-P lysine aminoacylase GenX [Acetobacter lambici]|uniref:EF-P lysine aminoacylase EpmA n=1 Tax=Acetobacter lambici TaxID=1332824 RepID=A0ABT1F098_9PROT|nr:EF-P lysine aminoacylase EpmA [Acetobacter lambici]MCP1241571.1 EF-P lysine aminoacylase EpmA [Acetobacter lambici]MCP1257709.1 EF-P lysine aminoacylase EpmA [Acetobacter lambici]NHO56194.1 EF-P lysine aminoacylase GenX [Acetobacter lambici]